VATSTEFVVQYGRSTDLTPHHLYSARCGGFNTEDRIIAPYNCSIADFRMMMQTGWLSSDYRRAGVVSKALEQIRATPSINQPEYASVQGIGLCSESALDFYLASGNWCSEFVRDVYLWSWHIPNISYNGEELEDVTNVNDLVYLFQHSAATWHYSFPLNRPQPGDYLAHVGGDPRQHFGHSAIVMGVADNYSRLWTMNGNTSFPINGVSHQCVVMKHEDYFVNNTYNTEFDMLGVITNWLR
jgi:hypothetical protein